MSRMVASTMRHSPVRILSRELMQRGPPLHRLPCRCMMSPLLLRLAVSVSTPQRRNVHDSRRALAANYNNYTSDRKKKSDNENDTPEMHIRLSKRMSELGICSRREAARILYEVNKCNDRSLLKDLKEVIYLRGMPVMDGAAVKVPPDEKYIEIRSGDDPPHERVEPGRNESCVELKECIPYPNRPWKEIMGDTIILHKPIGYVSGQEEHQHVPAVRLLNRENMHLSEADKDMHAELRNGDALHFDRWKFSGYDVKANSVPKHIRITLDEEQLSERNNILDVQTLSGYAPAGRLDIDSTGVLLFTRAGIMARRLIEPESKIPKEYIVTVEPAVQLNAWERELHLKSLPRPTRDLSVLLRHGNRLAGERNPLKPLLVAEWLDDKDKSSVEDLQQHQTTKTMRLVLIEGKKRQIRRMCREILGWHVVKLFRSSVGPVKLGSLPEGKWRPLTQREVMAIFNDKQHVAFKRSTSVNDSSSAKSAKEDATAATVFPETKVMREVVGALKREPTGWLPIATLQKQVGKRLHFLPKKEGMRKQWKEQLLRICRDNPTSFIFRGTQNIGLRRKVGIDGDNSETKSVVNPEIHTQV